MPGARTEGEPELGVVVVNYGSSRLLAANLAAIDRDVLPPSMMVVVDNRTTDEERARVEGLAKHHGWEMLAPERNLGFGAGTNVGVARAAAAGCRTFLLINPDVAIDGPAVAALVRASADHPLTVITPRLDRTDGTTWFAGGQLDPRTGLTRSRPDARQDGPDRWLTGACLVVDRATWALVGGFDEAFFLYWEDVDLSRRVLDAGGQLLVVHDIVAVHEVGATQGSQGKSATYCHYMCRNRLLFATRHLRRTDRLRWLWHAPRYAMRVLLRDGGAAALRRPSRIAAACWGTASGAAMVLRSLVMGSPHRMRGRDR